VSAKVICFAAARVARMLRQNAAPDSAADFIAHMAALARAQQDSRREAFWSEVAGLMRRTSGGARPLGATSAVS
jgi:hypothetical protein